MEKAKKRGPSKKRERERDRETELDAAGNKLISKGENRGKKEEEELDKE